MLPHDEYSQLSAEIPSHAKMAGPPRRRSMNPGNQQTVSSSSPSSTGITISITELTGNPITTEPRTGPRRGGCTSAAWLCCVCKYHNKIGRSVCSNSKKAECAERLSADEVSERPKSEWGLNHHRCEACYPSGYGVYINGHDRRWPKALFGMERESVDEDADHELVDQETRDFDQMLMKRKPGMVVRDPLTWQRMGAWPGT